MKLDAQKGNTGCLLPYVKLTNILAPPFRQQLIDSVSLVRGYLILDQIPLVFLIANSLNGNMAEVGVLFGRTTCALAMGSLASGLTIHCVDTFLGSGKEHEVITSGGSYFRDTFEEVLRIRGHSEQVVIREGLSQQIASTYPDFFFDAVWIDGAHDYDNVVGDINAWYPKLKPGGMMLGHDYSEPSMPNRDFLELVVAVDKCVKNDTARFTDFGWFYGIWAAVKVFDLTPRLILPTMGV